jgi:hypothetical protein
MSLWFPDFVDAGGDDVFDDGTVYESYGDTTDFYAEAREICNTCPMKDACLEYAMEHRIRFGMFGGQTPIERRRVERRDRRKRLQDRRKREAAETATEPDLDFDDTVEY